MKLYIQPITLAEASEFISRYHSHHKPTKKWKFGVAVNDGDKVVGVAVVSRPVARMFDDGWTLEVARCCTDGTKNAASMLYGATKRIAQEMGYRRLVTYTLDFEKGTSLVAAGWKMLYQTRGGTWDRRERPRVDKHPTGAKLLWEGYNQKESKE